MICKEYKSLEWIVGEQIWQQISHDHVKYFSIENFDCNFNVVSKGVFGNGEWSFFTNRWGKTSNRLRPPSNLSKLIELENCIPILLEKQTQGMQRLIGIYGAAGKSMLFAYDMEKLGVVNVVAYDEELLFWDKFLEASGTQVRNPIEIIKLDLLTNLIVMNPNHFDYVVSNYGTFASIHK